MTLLKSNLRLPVVPQFFDDFFSRDLFDWGLSNNSSTYTTVPSVNILEKENAFMVEMASPGMDKTDFQIELDNETLTISSHKEKTNDLAEKERYTRREYSYQSFKRSFLLPKKVVDESQIEARYQDGILRILIPKNEGAKTLPPRQIDIT